MKIHTAHPVRSHSAMPLVGVCQLLISLNRLVAHATNHQSASFLQKREVSMLFNPSVILLAGRLAGQLLGDFGSAVSRDAVDDNDMLLWVDDHLRVLGQEWLACRVERLPARRRRVVTQGEIRVTERAAPLLERWVGCCRSRGEGEDGDVEELHDRWIPSKNVFVDVEVASALFNGTWQELDPGCPHEAKVMEKRGTYIHSASCITKVPMYLTLRFPQQINNRCLDERHCSYRPSSLADMIHERPRGSPKG